MKSLAVANSQAIRFGYPKKQQLYKWITTVDLELWNIYLKDPVAIRNFLTQYTDYTSDQEQFDLREQWQDPKLILESGKDDCDGLANLACSILYTLGYDCRLAIGRYDIWNNQLEPEKRILNHAYGLLYLDDEIYIVECTGNTIIKELPKLSESPEYYTLYMGDAITKTNYVCNHLVEKYSHET